MCFDSVDLTSDLAYVDPPPKEVLGGSPFFSLVSGDNVGKETGNASSPSETKITCFRVLVDNKKSIGDSASTGARIEGGVLALHHQSRTGSPGGKNDVSRW